MRTRGRYRGVVILLTVLWAGWLMAGRSQPEDRRFTAASDGGASVAVEEPVTAPSPDADEDADTVAFADAPAVVPYLKQVFSDAGVPPGLIWMVEVESAWDPRAVSDAGAAGLFQMMPETAERYGLSTFPHDERYGVGKSASAAASYLRSLHDQFGSWSLALAAYNAGEGCVQRALDRCGASTFLEVAPHLPAQTRSYVPRVMDLMAARQRELAL